MNQINSRPNRQRRERGRALLARGFVLLGGALVGLGSAMPVRAVTSLSVDGHPSPVTVITGETVTVRFDIAKVGGTTQIVVARDLTRSGKWDPTLPISINLPLVDGGGNDTDTAAGRGGFALNAAVGLPAGPYLFVVQDQSDNSVMALPITVVPKPEPQALSGSVAVIAEDGSAGLPRDAVIWAYKDSQTPVASADLRSDGGYTLPVPPGSYVVFAEWFGHLRSKRQTVTVAAGHQVPNLNIPLLKGEEVSGVLSNGGKRTADALIQTPAEDGKVYTARTMSDGAYTLALPPGKYQVIADGAIQPVTVADQPIDGVDFPILPDGPVPAQGTIVTIAGNGLRGLGGDGRRASTARVPNPNAITMDRQDNLYIVDVNTQSVRVVRNGSISTVAGNSNPEAIRGLRVDFRYSGGFAGDGGPARQALLLSAQGIAFDAAGNLHIADTGNHRVRKVDANGVITTIAGSGPAGPGSVGEFSGDGGPALQARFNRPLGVIVDELGNVYVTEPRSRRVRKISPNGTITTVLGGGTSPVTEGAAATSITLTNPSYLAVDQKGNLLVSDTGLNRILRVSPAGSVSIVAGNGTAGFSGDGGPATAAQLADPYGMAFDSAGNLFFAERSNHRVRKVSPDGIIATVAGSGPAGPGSVGSFGGDGGPATQGRLNIPTGVAIDSRGDLYIADGANSRIRKVIGVAAPGALAPGG
jgi:sugar lactone lactonase YvrE